MVADETAMELRHYAPAQDIEEKQHHKHDHHELRAVILSLTGLVLLCYLYKHPLSMAARVLRGEFLDNDAFVAVLEFYYT